MSEQISDKQAREQYEAMLHEIAEADPRIGVVADSILAYGDASEADAIDIGDYAIQLFDERGYDIVHRVPRAQLRDAISVLLTRHSWSGSLYTGCRCEEWHASRRNEIVSHPGHVADKILALIEEMTK